MDVNGIKRSTGTTGYGIAPSSGGRGSMSNDNFHSQYGNQLKEDYRKRADKLVSDLENLGTGLLDHISITDFERYRGLLKELLTDIVRNAYAFSTEQIRDGAGHQRVFSARSVIDEKLYELGKTVLLQNSGRINYLSRVDEIRGLIMDMLL